MPRTVKSPLRAPLAFALASALAAGARAHDSVHGTSLVWASDSAGEIPLIVTNRGLVFSDTSEAGVEFRLRCRSAYGSSSSDRPGVTLSTAGRVIIGLYNGVYATSDLGCSTELATGLPEGESLSNLVEVPGSPPRLLVSTRTFTGVSGVFKSEDGGRSFSEAHRNPADRYYDRLFTAPSDPLRVYAAGRGADRVNKQPLFFCSSSSDGGSTWRDQLVPTKLVPFAVHPTQPDVVFAYQPVDSQETEFRLLRSEDGGASFTPVLEYCAPPDADAGADAGRGGDGGVESCVPRGVTSKPLRMPTSLAGTASALWLGVDDGGGLFRSTDDGRTFEQVEEGRVQSVTCLTQRGERLWLCANMAPNTTGIWYSDDGGQSLEELMTFPEVTQPVMCDDLEAQVLCSREWYDFDLEQRALAAGGDAGPELDAAPDAQPSMPDAGAGADSAAVQQPRPKPSSDCQVHIRGGHRAAAAWAVALAAWALFASRRRRVERVRRAGLRN